MAADDINPPDPAPDGPDAVTVEQEPRRRFGKPVDEAKATGRVSRKRRVVVWLLIVVACILTLVSSLTVWAKVQILDTDRWVSSSAGFLENADVRSALAVKMTDTLFDRVDVQARLQNRLPDALDPLAAPIAGLLRDRAPAVAERMLEGVAGRQAWEEINRRVHAKLVDLLEGKTTNVTLQEGGNVVLDLRPLVDRLSQRLGIDITLPEGAGQYTLMQSDQLVAAQKAVRAIKVLTVFLSIVVIALLAFAVWLARGFRREAVRGAAAGILIVGIILLVVRRALGGAIVDSLTTDQTSAAGAAVWYIVTDLLRDIAVGLVAYGAIGLIGVFVAGPSRFGRRARQWLAPGFRRHPVWIFACVLVIFLVALSLMPAANSRALYMTLVLGGLAMLGVEALRRQTLREFPTAEPPPGAPAPSG